MKLKLQSLVKSYHNNVVVDNISFDISQGEIVGLLGPNGAGKTTTFYMVVGLLKPDSGSIYLDDIELTRMPMHKRARHGIGYLPQESSVFRKLTVAENLEIILELQNLEKDIIKQRIERYVNIVLNWQPLSKEQSVKEIIDTQKELTNLVLRVAEVVLLREFNIDVKKVLEDREEKIVNARQANQGFNAERYSRDQVIVYVLGNYRSAYRELLNIKALLSSNQYIVAYIIPAKEQQLSLLNNVLDSRITVKELEDLLKRKELLALQSFIDLEKLVTDLL